MVESYMKKNNYTKRFSNTTLFDRREKEFSRENTQDTNILTTNNTAHISKVFNNLLKTNLNLTPKPITSRNISNNSYFSHNFKTQTPLVKTVLKSNKISSRSKKYYLNSNYFNTSQSKAKIKQRNLFSSRKKNFSTSKNTKSFYKTQNSFDMFSKMENDMFIKPQIKKASYKDLIKNTYSFLTELNNSKKKVEPCPEVKKKITKIDGVSFECRDYSKIENVDILKKFLKKNQALENEILENSENDKPLEKKRRKLNLKESELSYINKICWMKFNKYSSNMKKEIFLRTKETNQSDLDFLEEKIQAMKYAQKLCGSQFSIKITNYVKYLNTKKDREKGICLNLIQEIYDLKNELKHMNSKMKKIETEKNNILKWVYLQIKMEQKKTILPHYYKTALNNFLLIEPFINQKSKKLNSSNEKEKENIIKVIKKSSVVYQNNFIAEQLSDEIIDFLSRENCVAEFNYIKEHYKNNLPFKTVDEFQEKMSSFESDDLQLIRLNSQIRSELIYLHNELNLALEKKMESESSNNELIIAKQNELSHVKFFYQINFNLMQKLKRNGKISSISTKNSSNINNNRSSKMFHKFPLNNKTLFYKINLLYDICSKFNKQEKILDLFNKNETQYIKEKGVLYEILLIEVVVDYLVFQYENYNKIFGAKVMKKLWSDIEKTHREEKTEEQKKERREKAARLKVEVEKRSNKIYFLPHKKVNMFNNIGRKKKKTKIKDDVNKIPEFDDFIFNGGENQ